MNHWQGWPPTGSDPNATTLKLRTTRLSRRACHGIEHCTALPLIRDPVEVRERDEVVAARVLGLVRRPTPVSALGPPDRDHSSSRGTPPGTGASARSSEPGEHPTGTAGPFGLRGVMVETIR